MAEHKLPRKEVAPRPDQTELRVGRLTKAHGLKGAIKVELYTDEPERRFVPGAVFTLQVPTASKWHGKTIELSELRWYNGHPVAFFAGVDDRTEAETLVKAILWVSQDVRQLPEEENAWYDHQLVGLGRTSCTEPVVGAVPAVMTCCAVWGAVADSTWGVASCDDVLETVCAVLPACCVVACVTAANCWDSPSGVVVWGAALNGVICDAVVEEAA